MKELNLELTGYQPNDILLVKIDGNPIKLKKDNKKSVYTYKTENEKAKIEIYKLLNVGGFFWFITQIFFFLITFFGLFGTHNKENCLVIDFEIEVELEEKSALSLQINKLTDQNKAVEISTNLPVTEQSNIATIDTKAKKVIKLLKITKILLALAIIVTTLLLI